jgi:2-keto-4-pentenoate hydratase/2-oxohepta-3-ene-1,7-dioic acid hydratase in catechol pathway
MTPAELRTYAENLMTERARTGAPYVFSKIPSAVTGPYDPVILPALARQPDWELELAVVISKPARHVRRAQAMDYVAGYTIANDITSRDLIWCKDPKAMGTDWISSKNSPTFLPLGPYLVPAAFVADPQKLRLVLKLNGETMQDESTSDMIFDIARQIEYISSRVQLWPGDIICTGSPAGNGTHYGRFLRDGDVMETSITGLGEQRNPCVAEANVR